MKAILSQIPALILLDVPERIVGTFFVCVCVMFGCVWLDASFSLSCEG
jgi:hypothetical protein